MHQEQLWDDTLSDALRNVVAACGGPKKVASTLWPTKQPPAAARYLNQCLEDERAEKLALDELMAVLKMGREADCHVAMYLIADQLNYEKPGTVDPESERDRLQREFIRATKTMQQLSVRMERLGESRND